MSSTWRRRRRLMSAPGLGLGLGSRCMWGFDWGVWLFPFSFFFLELGYVAKNDIQYIEHKHHRLLSSAMSSLRDSTVVDDMPFWKSI